MIEDIKTDQEKLKKLLKLLILMASEWHTIEELSIKLNCSNRTIYRYFKLFKSVGFEISRSATANIKNNSGTFIFKLSGNKQLLKSLL